MGLKVSVYGVKGEFMGLKVSVYGKPLETHVQQRLKLEFSG